MVLFVRGLIDRLLLIAAAIAGGLVPGFIAQYRQRLGGRLDQARLDLASWQKIADQLFQGDLSKLIQHHLDSRDPSFLAEAEVIRSLVATIQQLQEGLTALQGSVFHQAGYLALHLDAGLARATLGDWVPTFALSLGGLLFAAAFALLVWLLFRGGWALLSVLFGATAGDGVPQRAP